MITHYKQVIKTGMLCIIINTTFVVAMQFVRIAYQKHSLDEQSFKLFSQNKEYSHKLDTLCQMYRSFNYSFSYLESFKKIL